jgi:Cytochrome P460
MRKLLLLFSALALGLSSLWGCGEGRAASTAPGATMTAPVYDARGDMKPPEGYRTWMFVGTSLGLEYGASAQDGPGSFHDIYIQPEAYEELKKTGRFPEKTILVMEIYDAGTRDPKSGLTSGYFQDQFTGLSAAVKDGARFPEGWGYVTFMRDGSRMVEAATPFPRESCYDCHHEHGATDNVFTQFYPMLRSVPHR